MKRQNLECITCVCLVAYAAIVLVGQLGHWIPGWGCQCHVRGVTPSDTRAAIEPRFLFDSDVSVVVGSTTRARIQRAIAIDSDGRCPICDWFSMAQLTAVTGHRLIDVAVVRAASLPNWEIQHRIPSSILPRGPPFVLAHSVNL